MRKFEEKHLQEILLSNGSLLREERSILKRKGIDILPEFLKSISWLNKSSDPDLTEIVRITPVSSRAFWLPVSNVRVYFTGYRDLCPGQKERSCDLPFIRKIKCELQPNSLEESEASARYSCPYFSDRVRHPDISRLIEFHRT
jgi:hypothetical protein